jgi:hypothetical protein
MLQPADFDEFFTRGFIRLPAQFAANEVAELSQICDRLRLEAEQVGETGLHRGAQFVLGRVQGGAHAGETRIDRIVWAGAAEPELLAWGQDPRLLLPVAELLGTREMQHIINQIHYKLPGDGVEFPWHQDSSHRRYGTPEWRDVNGRGSYVQTVVAIDACGLDNGPLLFVENSCQLGHVPVGEHGDLPREVLDLQRVVPVKMDPGDVVLFGPYTIHGSAPNHSERSRRLFINGYAHPHANSRVYPGEGAGRFLAV